MHWQYAWHYWQPWQLLFLQWATCSTGYVTCVCVCVCVHVCVCVCVLVCVCWCVCIMCAATGTIVSVPFHCFSMEWRENSELVNGICYIHFLPCASCSTCIRAAQPCACEWQVPATFPILGRSLPIFERSFPVCSGVAPQMHFGKAFQIAASILKTRTVARIEALEIENKALHHQVSSKSNHFDECHCP